MRILFINQFFWPDAAATSQLLTDLTRALSDDGHEVAVICGASTYAPGDLDEEAPPVVAHRIPGIPFSRAKFMRPLSYFSFLIGALWTGFRIPKLDTVVTMTTPPMLFVVGGLLQAVRGTRHFVWAMDLFPEAFVDVGLLDRASLAARFMTFLAKRVYAKADGVIAIGECMRRRLGTYGIPPGKLHVAENWSHARSIFPQPARRGEPLLLLYSGNLGLSHEVDTLLYAIAALKDNPNIHFRFVGSGAQLTGLQLKCRREGLRNVSFGPYVSRARLAESLGECDLGLVTQRNSCYGSVVPSKTYGLMAAGRAIIYIGPRGTAPHQIIERFECGWNVECGDGPGFVQLLESLSREREPVVLRGAYGRAAFLAHYDQPGAVARISALIGARVESTEEVCEAG
jgi:colanic acid biosynthesis glycosyl transferase WcaI